MKKDLQKEAARWYKSMNLEHISIKNFKGVENMELDFTPGVNLLIGDNGVGKTSVLEAIAVVLAGMLKGLKGVPTKNILQSDIRFTIDETGDASTGVRYWCPSEISCTIRDNDMEYGLRKWRENEAGNTRTKTEDTGIVKWMQKQSNDLSAVLPLLCFQSDARVWQMHRGGYGKELRKKLDDRRCGYIGCLAYSLDIKGILAWCLKMEFSAFQKKQKIKEYEAFKAIVAEFMKNIGDLDTVPEIHYSGQLDQMVYCEGKLTMPISSLSAGYQSLLWIIMNLAYRLILLNSENVEDWKEMPGIVLIDEIDMHLHPKWQWNIVKALEKTFPSMQFILATHSPIVISSCKNEHLLRIDEDQEVFYLEDAYGYSVQDVLILRQGTTEKPKEVKELDNLFEEAIDQDDWKKAERVIKEMEKILGDEHTDVRSAREELELNRWVED